MEIPFQMVAGIGLVLCALAVGQVALWSSASWRTTRADQRRFRIMQQELRRSLSQVAPSPSWLAGESVIKGQTWRGFRTFLVERLVKEAATTTSVYLVPADGKPMASYLPGQHLTLKFLMPGQTKPIVRCYSLSDCPNRSYYRITVKEVPPPRDRPELGFGKASHFINQQLQTGQLVEVKAPAGEFYLKENSDRLVVLLAGGVGITPMVSMLNHLANLKSKRSALLIYGVRHGQDHPFKRHLQEIAQVHENIHVLTCYSQPQANDRLGEDYQVHGNVNPDLLKRVLHRPDAVFYLCGPPPFMQSMYEGLLEWGAHLDDIHFEAFGPASIQQSPTPSVLPQPVSNSFHFVKFARSETEGIWDGQQTLLELAEAAQVPVESGCRAGSCGTCCVGLISGKVEYPSGMKPDCPPAHCLLCVAKPQGAVELDV